MYIYIYMYVYVYMYTVYYRQNINGTYKIKQNIQNGTI